MYLLQLYRRRRYTRHVVHHPRNASDFVDDAIRHRAQQFIRQVRPVRGHEVDGLHGAQRHHEFITTAVAITPTERTGRNTVKAWLTCSYHPCLCNSSMKIASARRSRSAYSFFTSPRMRTPSPGPGNGWR